MSRDFLRYGLGFGIAAALILAAAGSAARANVVDQSTWLTFHEPVRIPGNMVLPAGTYLFKAVNTLSSNNDRAVRIFNADGTFIYATLATRPEERANTSGNSQLSFAEPGGQRQPIVLLSWFYPDALVGHIFEYSGQETSRIAEARKITVVARTESNIVSPARAPAH